MDVEHLCIACALTQVIAEGTFMKEGCEEILLTLSLFVGEETKPEFHPKTSKKPCQNGCETRAQPHLHGEMFKVF